MPSGSLLQPFSLRDFWRGLSEGPWLRAFGFVGNGGDQGEEGVVVKGLPELGWHGGMSHAFEEAQCKGLATHS